MILEEVTDRAFDYRVIDLVESDKVAYQHFDPRANALINAIRWSGEKTRDWS